jgi:hypothetical protein
MVSELGLRQREMAKRAFCELNVDIRELRVKVLIIMAKNMHGRVEMLRYPKQDIARPSPAYEGIRDNQQFHSRINRKERK